MNTTSTTNAIATCSTRTAAGRSRAAVTAAGAFVALLAALLITTGCSGSIRHNYGTFQSALDRGASCQELFDQRTRFNNADTLAKIDRDLARIGCTSPDATRRD